MSLVRLADAEVIVTHYVRVRPDGSEETVEIEGATPRKAALHVAASTIDPVAQAEYDGWALGEHGSYEAAAKWLRDAAEESAEVATPPSPAPRP